MLASLLAVFIMAPINYQMNHTMEYPDNSGQCHKCEVMQLSEELVDQIDSETCNLFLSGYMAFIDRDFVKMYEMLEYIDQNVQLIKITEKVAHEWLETQIAK